jgi:nucleotide-binding universal stress UspA family protein
MGKKKQAPNDIQRVEFKKILYATDLSESGRRAFPYAASIAHRYGAGLTVFHVLETVEFEKTVVGYISEDLWRKIKKRSLQEARNILMGRKRKDVAIRDSVDEFCQEALGEQGKKPYITYDVVVKAGDTVQAILKEARKGNYDLIVLGKKGRRAIEDALIGTTARRVMRRCSIPVMVVPLPEGKDAKPSFQPGSA